MNKKLLGLLAGLAFALSAPVAKAVFVVAPNAYETTQGSASTLMLGNNTFPGSTRQWVFPATEFSSISPGTSTTSIGFRAEEIHSDVSYTQWDLQLSTAVNPFPTLDSTFANNIGTDVVTVFSGALSIAASSLSVGQFFDIAFITPYIYSGGDLLMTLRWSGPSSNYLSIDGNPVSDGLANTVYNTSSPTATSGQVGYFNYPITRFGVTVPEPTTLLLMSLGLAGIGYRRHRSKKVA